MISKFIKKFKPKKPKQIEPPVEIDYGIFNEDGQFHKLRKCKNSTKLLVVFTWMGASPGRFAFYKSLNSIKENVLFLNDKNNEWYQNGIPGISASVDDTCTKIKELADKLNAVEIITIGSSMGAYGALLYGAKLGSRSLAFSPETILNLPGSRSGKNIPAHIEKKYNDLRPHIKGSSLEASVITGELDTIDLLCASHIANLENIKVISIKGVAHGVPEFLHRKFGIDKVIDQFIKTNTLPDIAERGDLANYPHAIKLIAEAGEHIWQKQFRDAVNKMETLAKEFPNSDAILHKIGASRLKLKDPKSAERVFRKAVQISPYCAEAHHQLGVSLRSLGRYEEACDAQREALKISEKMPAATLHLGMALQDAGNIYEAETTLKSGYENNPKNPKFKEAYISCLHEVVKSRQRLIIELTH